MKPWIWFRTLAIVFALFTLGHTLGTLGKITPDQQEVDVINAMQGFRFPVMGFTRSYWQFYRGFSVSISVLLAILMLVSWQVASLSRRNPREAIPFARVLVLACIGNAIVGIEYFFTIPIVMSLVTVGCSVAGLLSLRSVDEPVSSASLAGRTA